MIHFKTDSRYWFLVIMFQAFMIWLIGFYPNLWVRLVFLALMLPLLIYSCKIGGALDEDLYIRFYLNSSSSREPNEDS